MSRVDLTTAVARLRDGHVVAIPTETVYGLAGRIDHDGALRAIFATKRRPFFDPLIVHVAEPGDARRLTPDWGAVHQTLADAFWPGPLTLILAKNPGVSTLITAGLDTVGVRCPDHPLAHEVLRQIGIPLAAPSANMFGRTSPTTAAHVDDEFGGRVPVLDGGAARVGVESTVIQVTTEAAYVLRPGAVTMEDLRGCFAAANITLPVRQQTSHRSPGHLAVHYQPANKVVLVRAPLADAELRARATALTGRPDYVWLELPGDPALAARVLYAELRRLSVSPAVILFDETDRDANAGWEAILDRLHRAATSTWT